MRDLFWNHQDHQAIAADKPSKVPALHMNYARLRGKHHVALMWLSCRLGSMVFFCLVRLQKLMGSSSPEAVHDSPVRKMFENLQHVVPEV